MEKIHKLTREGFRRYQEELDNLEKELNVDLAKIIADARALGDLSENAEYKAAKERQDEVNSRIAEIKDILNHSEVISDDEINTDEVNFGCIVRVLDKELDEEEEYKILGSKEVNIDENIISYESPVGKALMGRKVGDIVQVEAPVGIIEFEILSIRKESGENEE